MPPPVAPGTPVTVWRTNRHRSGLDVLLFEATRHDPNVLVATYEDNPPQLPAPPAGVREPRNPRPSTPVAARSLPLDLATNSASIESLPRPSYRCHHRAGLTDRRPRTSCLLMAAIPSSTVRCERHGSNVQVRGRLARRSGWSIADPNTSRRFSALRALDNALRSGYHFRWAKAKIHRLCLVAGPMGSEWRNRRRWRVTRRASWVLDPSDLDRHTSEGVQRWMEPLSPRRNAPDDD